MSVRTYSCRVNSQGGLTLPASVFKRLCDEGIACFIAGVEGGRAILTPLSRTTVAVVELSAFLALVEADLSSAQALSENDFGLAAAKAFPIRLDTPVVGAVIV